MPIADLHCHYPMHLRAGEEDRRDPALKALTRVRARSGWERLKAAILLLAARLFNFRRFCGGWRVSLDRLGRGDVRLVFSVLYVPEAEMDLGRWPDGDPRDRYFTELKEHLEQVNADLRSRDYGGRQPLVVTEPAHLDGAPDDNLIRFVHCVEGGFHLGASIAEVDQRVKELAQAGVSYITLAHLFWRHVATNAPALPFLSDRSYDRLFPQPRDLGLTELGEAAVRAMYRYGVLVDISHMRQPAIDRTFSLLGELDEEAGKAPADFPAIATHAGFRFGSQSYMLSPATIEAIAGRRGVIGLIMAHHQLNDNVTRRRGGLARTMRTVHRHIAEIHELTRSYEHIGIGSDLDGFIKPTVGGIENADDLASLAARLRADYPSQADAMLYDNALRVLKAALARRAENSL
jgi:microsomal dipeptidase-like Zn-dependent dipeptidase